MHKNKKGNQLLRLETILEKDRLSVGNEYVGLISDDVAKVLADYMDLVGKIKVSITKENKNFSITVLATAKRLKSFFLPSKE